METRIPTFSTPGQFGLAPTASVLGRLQDYFIYVINTTLAYGQTSDPQKISIPSYYDFQIISFTGEVYTYTTGVGTIVDNPLLTMQVKSQSDTLLSDASCLWNEVVGTAQRPFYFLGNIIAKANTVIEFTFTSLASSGTYYIHLAIHGLKNYK